ncbi:MAG: cellulose biosynthesis cyclic di-GMP-binding regulatory protein BcsB [Chloroflexota bacterium]
MLGQVSLAQDAPTTDESPVDVVTAVPFSESPPGTIEVSLAQLGEETLVMRGPIDAQEVSFSLPYRWQFQQSGYLQLYFDLLFDTFGQDATSDAGPNAQFEVEIDDQLVASINVTEVGQNQSLQIPLALLNKPTSNRHSIRFILNTGRDCDDEGRTSFLIHNYSFMHIEYDQAPLDLDLITFPRPLVQELLTPETIHLVVPDNYSDADLSAAASVSAMLGQRTDDSIGLQLITASEATAERLGDTHVVAIGTPSNNSYIADLYTNELLPTGVDGGGAIVSDAKEIFAEDGVLQLALTGEEEESESLVLVVSGTTDAGVARAAQALSVPQTEPRFGFEGPLAVIEAVNDTVEEADSEAATTVYTLAELGFRDTTLYGVGTQTKTASFFVPSNWRITEDALLLITYIPSAVLQSEGSALTVELNNRPVGSTILDGSIEGERELLVRLPADEILLGDTNRLRFQVTMDMAQPCLEPNLGLAWTRIKDNGRLQITHAEAGTDDPTLVIEDPLTPLISRPDLSDVWFALPEAPTAAELNGFVAVASKLGDISRGHNFAPQVALGVAPDEDALAKSHLISFGEPLRSPALALVNDELPQPFLDGTNSIRQQVGSVTFRLPEDFSLGLVEAIHAPWNPHRAVTVVSGTNPEGTNWAINAVTTDELLNQINGNLAFVRNDRVEALDLMGFTEARAPLSIIPETVAKAVQPEEIADAATETAVDTTAETAAPAEEDVALEPVPTPAPETFPEPGPLPAEYQPQATGLPSDLRTTVFGLIGAGLLIAVLGLFLSTRRAR